MGAGVGEQLYLPHVLLEGSVMFSSAVGQPREENPGVLASNSEQVLEVH